MGLNYVIAPHLAACRWLADFDHRPGCAAIFGAHRRLRHSHIRCLGDMLLTPGTAMPLVDAFCVVDFLVPCRYMQTTLRLSSHLCAGAVWQATIGNSDLPE